MNLLVRQLKTRFVIITDEHQEAKTFHTADRLQQEAKKLYMKYYVVNLQVGIHQMKITLEDYTTKMMKKVL